MPPSLCRLHAAALRKGIKPSGDIRRPVSNGRGDLTVLRTLPLEAPPPDRRDGQARDSGDVVFREHLQRNDFMVINDSHLRNPQYPRLGYLIMRYSSRGLQDEE